MAARKGEKPSKTVKKPKNVLKDLEVPEDEADKVKGGINFKYDIKQNK